MYEKNLTESFRLRLSKDDMTFLTEVSEINGITVSEALRQILATYRRSKEGEMSYGDTKTFVNNLI